MKDVPEKVAAAGLASYPRLLGRKPDSRRSNTYRIGSKISVAEAAVSASFGNPPRENLDRSDGAAGWVGGGGLPMAEGRVPTSSSG